MHHRPAPQRWDHHDGIDASDDARAVVADLHDIYLRIYGPAWQVDGWQLDDLRRIQGAVSDVAGLVDMLIGVEGADRRSGDPLKAWIASRPEARAAWEERQRWLDEEVGTGSAGIDRS